MAPGRHRGKSTGLPAVRRNSELQTQIVSQLQMRRRGQKHRQVNGASPEATVHEGHALPSRVALACGSSSCGARWPRARLAGQKPDPREGHESSRSRSTERVGGPIVVRVGKSRRNRSLTSARTRTSMFGRPSVSRLISNSGSLAPLEADARDQRVPRKDIHPDTTQPPPTRCQSTQ
jgi:hypothetical protein